MPVNSEFADRLKELPPYLFVEIDKAKKGGHGPGAGCDQFGNRRSGLSRPTPIVEAMKKALDDGNVVITRSTPDCRRCAREIARWFPRRFNVALNSDTEIYQRDRFQGRAGPSAVWDHQAPKTKWLLTDPAYPAYRPALLFCRREVVRAALKRARDSSLTLLKLKDQRSRDDRPINYPNNPTAVTAPGNSIPGLGRPGARQGDSSSFPTWRIRRCILTMKSLRAFWRSKARRMWPLNSTPSLKHII